MNPALLHNWIAKVLDIYIFCAFRLGLKGRLARRSPDLTEEIALPAAPAQRGGRAPEAGGGDGAIGMKSSKVEMRGRPEAAST